MTASVQSKEHKIPVHAARGSPIIKPELS